MEWIALLSRWLHITAAIAAVGGPMFMVLTLFPVAQGMPDEQRRTLLEAVRRRWAKVVMASLTVLLATGLYNFIWFLRMAKGWGPAWQAGSFNMHLYQMLFGVKFVLALAIFFIASAVSGRMRCS